jgi:hypothetical protein
MQTKYGEVNLEQTELLFERAMKNRTYTIFEKDDGFDFILQRTKC